MTRCRRAVASAAVALCVAAPLAQAADALPGYEPAARVSGALRIWGNDRMAGVTRLWKEAFERLQPGVSIEPRLLGTGTALAGLYTGIAELAFMGRECTPKELMAFEWVFRYKPTRVELATGSLDAPGHSPALVAFVHADNPLARITLAELDAIFGREWRRGHDEIRSWDQLGLGGEWRGRPIAAYGFDVDTGTGAFFRHGVLEDSHNLAWERLRELRDVVSRDGSVRDAGHVVLDALAADPAGIAVSTLGGASPKVKPLALATDARGPWFEATRDNLVSRRYPLTRVISGWINRPPGQQPTPAVLEFLRYVLSREGQLAVARDGSFLPLSPEAVREQRKGLGVDER